MHREQERYGRRELDEGDTTIPIVEEEVTIGKREVERGRVRIHTFTEEYPVERPVQVREEHITVERHAVDRPATEADLAAAGEETLEITETAEELVVSKRARVVEEVTVRFSMRPISNSIPLHPEMW